MPINVGRFLFFQAFQQLLPEETDYRTEAEGICCYFYFLSEGEVRVRAADLRLARDQSQGTICTLSHEKAGKSLTLQMLNSEMPL